MGKKIGKNPTDPGKLGCKRHMVVDQNRVPLAVVISGANVHDSKEHDHSWDSLILARPNPRRLAQHACEDKGYDFPACRRRLAKKGYIVHIPYRGLDGEVKTGEASSIATLGCGTHRSLGEPVSRPEDSLLP